MWNVFCLLHVVLSLVLFITFVHLCQYNRSSLVWSFLCVSALVVEVIDVVGDVMVPAASKVR